MKDALLQHEDCNVVVEDWFKGAKKVIAIPQEILDCGGNGGGAYKVPDFQC